MKSQKFENEQREIVDTINRIKKDLAKMTGSKGKWNKYLGDVTNNVVIHYLSIHLRDNFSAVGPGVYIGGIGNEFDLLVVDKNAKPIKFSNAYPRDSVHIAVEVKERGFFYPKRIAERFIAQARNRILESLQGIPFLYITLHESEKIMDATKSVYGPDSFFLSTGTGRNLEILPHEWSRFVETVQRIVA